MARTRGYNQQATIRRILALYGEKAAAAARQALRENAESLVEEMKNRCPVETGFYSDRHFKLKHPGRLRDSIHVEEGGKKDVIQIVADAKDDKGYPYAAIIEYSPRGQAFMKPAYEAKKIEMINHSKDLIRAANRK